MKTLLIITAVVISSLTTNLSAVEYHVSINGSNSNDGSGSHPFKTISAAAKIAQPGDVITVHAGTYRERINPPRGGESDAKRIVYRAADGEKVEIKGSEIVTGWKPVEKGVWKVTLPNSFFGGYNPYKDVIAGDWFKPQGRVHHMGEVYLNGKTLFEEVELDKLSEKELTWYCESDDKQTTIWANFGDTDPKQALVEINVRPTIFYPDTPGRNYITVRGFTMRHAASQWAPPTAEQQALIGTHWSKGWIIEDNVISDSKCVGLTLGKYGDEHDNTSADSAGGYVETIKRALKNGWSKENIGSHIVRNNTIYNCGAAGICGSMGGAFSEITGNHIYNINIDKPWTGHEMAGIKFHAPTDMLIKNNRIHHTSRGIWLDWMTQGTRVSANLLYENGRQDLYIEVNHGPYIVDNNIFLTPYSLKDRSQGGSYLHNLFAGKIDSRPDGRRTPYHLEHSTNIAGMSKIHGGDNRFHNNIIAGNGLVDYDEAELACSANGNVYLNGAQPLTGEKNYINEPAFNANIKLLEKKDTVYLHIDLPENIKNQRNLFVTTELLGKAKVPGLPFLNYDQMPLKIDTDFFGKKRNEQNPTAGPFENIEKGQMVLKLR